MKGKAVDKPFRNEHLDDNLPITPSCYDFVMSDNSEDENVPAPTITDIHGRHVDPFTGRILEEGETSGESIFAASAQDPDALPSGEGYYHGLGQAGSFKEMM